MLSVLLLADVVTTGTNISAVRESIDNVRIHGNDILEHVRVNMDHKIVALRATQQLGGCNNAARVFLVRDCLGIKQCWKTCRVPW